MLVQMSIYLTIGLILVASMARMILRIGHAMGNCPVSKRAAKTAATTIAAGYSMIGFGGVALIGSLIPSFDIQLWAILPALGMAAICLGLGFTHAANILRAVVRDATSQRHEPSSATEAPWSATPNPAPGAA